MRLATLLKGWDEFWYATTSPLSVAVYRILLGLITITFVLLLTSDLFVWFGSQGMCSNQAVADWTNGKTVYLNVLSFFPNNDNFLVAFHIVFFLAAVCLTIGYKTRLAAVICFVCLTTLFHRNPFIFNSGDTYLRVSTFWLIFSASGEALAIDGLKQRRDQRQLPKLQASQYLAFETFANTALHCILSYIFFQNRWWPMDRWYRCLHRFAY